jgi:hypothetical protein
LRCLASRQHCAGREQGRGLDELSAGRVAHTSLRLRGERTGARIG